MAVTTQAGKPAFDTLTTENRTYNIDTDVVIGMPVQFVAGSENFVEPFTNGVFAGIVMHTDDNTFDETTNTKTITAPTTIKAMHRGNLWVKTVSAAVQGGPLFIESTGAFGTNGTELSGHFDGSAAANDEVIIVLDSIRTL